MMMLTPTVATRDLVLIGGGHTHALVLHHWAKNPMPDVRLTVINPSDSAPYTGMLPGYIAGHYARQDLQIDLARLCDLTGARLVLGKAEAMDRVAHTIHVPGHPPIAYDVAALDIGITSDIPSLPGYGDHAQSAKPLGGYATAWEEYLDRLRAGTADPRIAVIGGGVAGVELAMAMAFRLRGHEGTQVTVLEAAPAALPAVGRAARARLLRHMGDFRIDLRTGVQVVSVDAGGVRLADGGRVDAALVLGAAGSRPQDWLQDTGLKLTDGYVTVTPTLQSVSDAAIFAVGDCAHMAHAPRPKAGVYAVRQAPYLLHNLRAALGAGALKPYHPQRDYLKLISLGDRSALADKWGLPLEGRWLWWLKDRIDAKFMGQFR